MAETMSSAEVMKEFGISRSRLQKWIDAKCPIEPHGPNENLRFPRKALYSWYDKYVWNNKQ